MISLTTLGTPARRERTGLLLLACGYAALALLDLFLGSTRSGTELVAGVLGTVVLGACIGLATRAPLLSVLVGGLAVCVEAALNADVAISPAATLVCIYAVGRQPDRARAIIGLGAAMLSVAAYYALTPPFVAAELVATLVAYAAFWALAYAWGRGDREAERAARGDRQLLLAQVRTQLAGDLHDIIGHTLNVVVVHAGAARLSLESDPPASRELLLQIERVGREALTELDEAIEVLRDPTSVYEGPAQPVAVGLAGVPGLVSRFDGSGVHIILDLDPQLLTAAGAPSYAVGLEAYRIVQEALTNTLKHAAPCTVQLRLESVGGRLAVAVSDDGAGPAPGWCLGRGLTGIKQRAARVGGTASVGASRAGFLVEALLPLERQPV